MVDCGGDGVFAYVYPTRPFQIFLCGAFWNAGMTGTDSKPGTIIHELSHFDVLAERTITYTVKSNVENWRKEIQ